MAKFRLQIDMGNDAFVPDPGPEVARILREAATMIERGAWEGRKVRDINGNTVGDWKTTGRRGGAE